MFNNSDAIRLDWSFLKKKVPKGSFCSNAMEDWLLVPQRTFK